MMLNGTFEAKTRHDGKNAKRFVVKKPRQGFIAKAILLLDKEWEKV